MSDALFAGSAAAAFGAGLVAFFAPCCSGVMVPTYLAAVGGGSRWRLARLTALYVAGVAAVVWPITLGASALASLITRWHAQLFLAGGLLMIGVAVALYRDSMLPVSLPQPALTGSAISILGLGAFSGAATACCAPVLAGAVALSAGSGAWWGGAFLGGAYILGLVAPLLPVAFAVGRAGGRLRDPRLMLRIGSYVKRTTVARLAGSTLFAGFGALFVVLALTGRAESAPGFQRTLGSWLTNGAAWLDAVPNVVAVPLLVALALLLLFAVTRPKGEQPNEQEAPSSQIPAEASRAPLQPMADRPRRARRGRARGRVRGRGPLVEEPDP